MSAYIFYGKAGSGKGTQAALLKSHLESTGQNVLYIETGNLFRNFVANNNSIAAVRTREILDSGELMPPFFPIYLWANQLVEIWNGTDDIIFDGAARRLEEAHTLASALTFFKVDRVSVFEISISDDTAIARVASRNQGRADDSSSAKTMEKMHWYRDNVAPAIEFWKTCPNVLFHEINGELPIEEVFGQITSIL